MNNNELTQQNSQIGTEEKNKLTPELTDEEFAFYKQKAESLAVKYGVSKVHPVVAIDPDTFERVVCYIKEPNYDTKIRVMDKVQQIGGFSAGEELRQICTLKEESDPITYSDTSASDKYKMGILDECMSMITKIQNQFKKKSKSLK